MKTQTNQFQLERENTESEVYNRFLEIYRCAQPQDIGWLAEVARDSKRYDDLEREAAQEALEERGIDWRTYQESRASARSSEWIKLGRDVASLYGNLFSLIAGNIAGKGGKYRTA